MEHSLKIIRASATVSTAVGSEIVSECTGLGGYPVPWWGAVAHGGLLFVEVGKVSYRPQEVLWPEGSPTMLAFMGRHCLSSSCLVGCGGRAAEGLERASLEGWQVGAGAESRTGRRVQAQKQPQLQDNHGCQEGETQRQREHWTEVTGCAWAQMLSEPLAQGGGRRSRGGGSRKDTAGEVWLRPEAEAKEGEQTESSLGGRGCPDKGWESCVLFSLPG